MGGGGEGERMGEGGNNMGGGGQSGQNTIGGGVSLPIPYWTSIYKQFPIILVKAKAIFLEFLSSSAHVQWCFLLLSGSCKILKSHCEGETKGKEGEGRGEGVSGPNGHVGKQI